MKHTSFAFLSLLSSSLLAACGDDPPNPPNGSGARFADATEEQLGRAFMAGTGADATIAELIAGGYAAFPIDGSVSCPTITRDGDQTTVTGGCDLDDGGRIEGTVVFSNVRPLFGEGEYDPELPTVITFTDYSSEDADGVWTFDGTVRREPGNQLSVDLRAGLDVGDAHSDLELDCESAVMECTALDGSRIEITGLGAADVSGTWKLDQQDPRGSLILTGADVLELDFERATETCIPYSIDGEDAGELCDLQ
jgi:hypothetical protein